MAIVKLQLKAVSELNVRRIDGADYANGKDRHAPIGLGSNGDIARQLTNFQAPTWPASGRIVRAYIDGWTGEIGPHAAFNGNSPRIHLFRNADKFTETLPGSDGENDWTQNAPQVYPGVDLAPGDPIQFSPPTSINRSFRVGCTSFAEAWAPPAILRISGLPGGNAKFNGVTMRGIEDAVERSVVLWTRRGNSDRRMVLTIEIDTSTTPNAPVITEVAGAVEGTSDPTIVGTESGRELTVSFGFSSPTAGDRAAKAELALYEETATDIALGPAIGTTGWITPTDLPSGSNQHRISLTGLPYRQEGRFAVRTQSQDGKVGPWSSVEDAIAHVQLGTIGGVPIDPRMQGVTDDPHIFASINSADPTDYVTGIRVEAYRRVDGERTQAAFGEVDIGGTSTRRAEVAWSRVSGVSLRHGETIEWRVWLKNRDGVWSQPTAWLSQVVRDRVGPTLTPAEQRFTTRTPQFTITDASFDGWRLRLLSEDGNTVIYDSGATAIAATTTHSPTIPSGYLAFGQRFQALASTRPASSGTFGPENEPQFYYVTSLPVTNLTVEDWITGTRVQTTDIPWLRTMTDADGDVINVAELEIRVAASPQGSGALIERRYDDGGVVPTQEKTGFQLEALTSATGWTADANITPTTENQQPAGYAGNSLEFEFTASATDRAAWLMLPEPVDLSRYGSGALVTVWRRLSSVTNLTTARLRIGSSATDYGSYEIANGSSAVDTWAEAVIRLGTPTTSSGTQDLSAIDRIGIFADLSASYAGSWYLRDLRIGTTQTAKTVPDGYIAWESSVDARARARDDASVLVSTTLSGTEAAGQTVLSITSTTGLTAGDSIRIAGDVTEVREIATVDSGVQVTVSEALDHSHASGQAVTMRPWGPWSGWVTVPVARPPDVALSAPADAATVTRPWPTFEWAYTGYGGRAQLSAEVHIAIEDGDEPLYVIDVDGDAEEATAPFLLLEDDTEYTWWVVVTDESGLTGTSSMRTFTTAFTEPAVSDEFNAVPDPSTSEVVLDWPASTDPDLAFYVLEHQDENGLWVRIDGGPETLDDGRTPLTVPEFHHLGGMLGINSYRLSLHNGWRSGEPLTNDAELTALQGGSWLHVRRDLVIEFNPTRAPRTHGAQIEEFRPPGGQPSHLSWGTSSVGRRVSITAAGVPSEDGALTPQIRGLLGVGSWLKAPAGYAWQPMWGIATSAGDEPQQGGILEVSWDFVETGAPEHGWSPEPEPETPPEEEPAPEALLDLDSFDFGSVEVA